MFRRLKSPQHCIFRRLKSPQLRIAINTRFLLPGKLEGLGWYTHEIVRRMVLAHPEDEFVFLFDRPYDQAFVYADNVTPVVVPPPARHPVLWYAWFEWAVPLVLKRYAPDVFFSPDGYCSLGSRVPTVMTLHDVIPLNHPERIPWAPRLYYQHYLPRFAHRANQIISVSEHVKQDIIDTCGVSQEQISVVYNGIRNGFQPQDEAAQQLIRKAFSHGKPFFLYTGAIHPRKNVDLLIRAFDQFKSMASNDVQLILAGRFAWQTGLVKTAYESAVHRNAIHFLGYVPDQDLPGLYGAAVALVNLSADEGFGLPLVEAMACGTPVVASDIPVFREIGGDAVLFVDQSSTAQVATGLQQVLEKKLLRTHLISVGKMRSNRFNWDDAAQSIYLVLRQCCTHI
ncbi:MAG: glycosyltransferase family 4 protein [Saprospiraceae bacterium]